MTENKKIAHISFEGRRISIAAPYDPAFVNDLKSSLKSRKWDPKRKVWLVDTAEREQVLALTSRFFEVIEDKETKAIPQKLVTEEGDTPKTDITADWLSQGNLEIWVDGACSGNPGPGGYGIILKVANKKKAMSGGFKLTTNNRMEILAAIVALESLPCKSRVVIHSDSQYVVDAMEKGWAKRWRANNWMRNKKEKAINPDLWERLLKLCEMHDVEFQWLRGHNHQTENERCDQIAQAAAHGQDLPIDPGYDPRSGT